ncbi:LCP family protein [Micromonospora sp. DR5-3]|uniref:LCP family protein n=1 Tax=unclassified Micromonospora TaxID=2617518 RepID=UPI0011D511BF|nr:MULTISPECIES: LCP family protein [unclassified Micromonospora]MCW3813663.1 LCP family protein [Micromonospora sp. DR5-3]TYC25638.1 LytR family transcriptional regulator [Micromonospora sp. MP36]
MIEDDLRAAFARHESLAPPAGPVRAAIDQTVVRRRRRLRLAGTAMAVVAAALTGFTAIAPQHREAGTLLAEPTASAPTGALNVLLLGVDAAGPDESRRADSILLVHVPADRSRLYLVSLPRDLLVPIPGQGTDKLNKSFTSSATSGNGDLTRGYDRTRQVVAQLTGVRIDAGAVLTYRAARDLTDAVGGVPVCLPAPVRSVHTDRRFPAGCQQLGGGEVVDLLRQRYGLRDAARDRDRNAERYAAGLLRQIHERGGLTDPVLFSKLIGQVGSGLVTDTGDLSLPSLVSMAGQAADAEPVGLGLPVRYVDKPTIGFGLDPALAPGFLDALRNDRLGEWTEAHPDQVNTLR